MRNLLYLLIAVAAAFVALGPLVARATLPAPCETAAGARLAVCVADRSTIVALATPHPVPTVTLEPTASPTTSPIAFVQSALPSDELAAGLAVDSAMWASESLATDYPELCSSQYGTTGCFREDRDGRIDVSNVSTVDLNWLSETFGMVFDFPVEQTQTTDADLATAAAQHACPKSPLYCGAMPINEPDGSYAGNFGSGLKNGTVLTAAPYTTDNGYNIGQLIIIGEGPTEETNTIIAISAATKYNLGSPLINTHTAVSAILQIAVNGSSGVGGTAKTLEILAPTPIPTPLSTNIPTPVATNPSMPTSTLQLDTVAGFSVGDYITVDCRWEIHQGAPIPETVQIQLINTAANTLTTNEVHYNHPAGALVGEGCVRPQPMNNWSILRYLPNEVNQLKTNMTTGNYKFFTAANAFPWDDDAYDDTVYGGTPYASPTPDIAQSHLYPSINAEGNDGDGAADGSQLHQATCFGYLAVEYTWQSTYCAALAKGGGAPLYITEFGWYMVPNGSCGSSTCSQYTGGGYGNRKQIPQIVGSAWLPRAALFELAHGFSKVFFFQLHDGAGGFCTTGLFQTTDCGGTSGYGLAPGSAPAPKTAYYSIMDLIGILHDPGCVFPGCKLNGSQIRWGWDSVDAHLRSTGPLEKADGSFLFGYWYAATDYNEATNGTTPAPSPAPSACQLTMACFQWCGNPDNQSPDGNKVACEAHTLYVVGSNGSHSWLHCVNIDTDINSSDPVGRQGHMFPTTQNFRANSQNYFSVSVKPEVQFIYCPDANQSPTMSGTPVPNATTPPAFTTTPNPTPTIQPTATPVPSMTPFSFRDSKLRRFVGVLQSSDTGGRA